MKITNKRELQTNRPLVLVVDDDSAMRLLVREVLEQDNLRVEEAKNGVEAITVFAQLHPDLIMMDVDMPRMNGFDACSRIKQQPGGDDTTIVMLTGLDDVTSIRQGYEAGATDFVTKPINWPILSQRVHYLLRARSTYRALKLSEERLSQAQAIAQMGNWEWNILTNELHWSDQIYRIFGLEPQEFAANYEAFLQSVHPEDREYTSQAVKEAIEQKKPYNIDHRVILPNGEVRVVHEQALVSYDHQDRPYQMLGTVQDITERTKVEEKIHALAYYDTLTGLPNRYRFKEQMTQALEHSSRNGMKTALIYMNLDRMKRINDTLGYHTGDQLLLMMTKRLKQCAEDPDILAQDQNSVADPVLLARLGGDEFAILLSALKKTGSIPEVVRSLLDALALPLVVDSREYFVTGSIGIAFSPEHGNDVDTLLKHADTAMRRAKKAGGNHFQLYAQSMNYRAFERLDLEGKLRRALQHGDLSLHYQPKVESHNRKTMGLEVLLRWEHPEIGFVPPANFIPLAEESGLIIPIGEWVLETACRQNRIWQEAGFAPVQIAVNLSVRQFIQHDMMNVIKRVLNHTRLDPKYLELELTESILMQDVEENIVTLQQLKDIGLELAIDDFGTGYSSMNYLKRLPLDTLKIDRSFVMDVITNRSDAAIVKSIVALAKNLGMKVVAEGVDTEEQRAFLNEQGCDQIQGHLISKPVPADQVIQFLSLEKKTDSAGSFSIH